MRFEKDDESTKSHPPKVAFLHAIGKTLKSSLSQRLGAKQLASCRLQHLLQLILRYGSLFLTP